MSSAIPVTMSGFTWGSALLLVLNLLVGGLFVQMVRTRPALKKIASDREANLLSERAADMEAMRARIAVLEAERAIDRHRINNVTQCFDAMILLIEASPEKASEHVRRIKEMRARQIEAESLEKATIHANNIAAASTP